ncbi:MAG: hypothetical protein JWO22_1616 [Frankiales bacterium]|nr:hypothetical protein [Frankiales bacterium]
MPLELELVPGLPAFTGVPGCCQAKPAPVLHARRVFPSRIVRNDGTPIATVTIDVPGSDQALLIRQRCRRADVREVKR